MSRRNGRILAFQALYSWDVSKSSLEDILNFSWLTKDTDFSIAKNTEEQNEDDEISPAAQEEQTFASLIISGTINNISEIDKKIEAKLSASWSMERINKVALAILRTGTYELCYQKDIDSNIVIDEAVNISREFGPDDSFKFINAVLDKISKDEKNK